MKITTDFFYKSMATLNGASFTFPCYFSYLIATSNFKLKWDV